MCDDADSEDLLARATEIIEIGPEPPASDVERINDQTRTCRIAHAAR